MKENAHRLRIQTSMFFDDTIKYLRNGGVPLLKIVHPFSQYLLCNHYYGDELVTEQTGITPDALLLENGESVKENDIVHVQVNHFQKFVRTILPSIEVSFVLSTGQWQFPQLHKDAVTDAVLNDTRVIAWISQNPIYTHPKYIAFPYGIRLSNLQDYAQALLHQRGKTTNVAALFIDKNTNACRRSIPSSDACSVRDFYTKVQEAEFVLSPIGDRDDCYRHYEAIGLGTTPISNVREEYKQLFGESMVYSSVEDMVSGASPPSAAHHPQKELVCLDYHRHRINELVCKLQASRKRSLPSSP